MKLKDINYQPLENMKGAWSRAMRDLFKLPPPITIVIVIAITLVSAIYIGQFSIWLAVIVFSFVSKKVVDYKNRAWKAFAVANGWTFTPMPFATERFVPPSLAGAGRSRRLSDVVHASFEGHNCDLFMYQFTTGSGKNSHTYYYTVARVALAKPFPHLILDNKKTWAIHNRGNASQKISLEGDFDKYFSFYSQPNEHINALSIVTPDIMQTLLTKNQFQDIEIADSYLYFMVVSDQRTATRLAGLLESVDALSDEIAHKAKTFQQNTSGQTPALAEFAVANLGASKSRDAVGHTMWGATLLVAFLPFIVAVILGIFIAIIKLRANI